MSAKKFTFTQNKYRYFKIYFHGVPVDFKAYGHTAFPQHNYY